MGRSPEQGRVRGHARALWVVAGTALVVLAMMAGIAAARHSDAALRGAGAPALGSGGAGATLARLPAAAVFPDPSSGNLVIELAPVALPAHVPGHATPMVMPPVARADIPVSGYLTGYHIDVVDGAGRRLPQTLLHHFNLNDPGHRELFLPISLHILAASRETPAVTVPWLLFGLPITAGQRFVVSAMLANDGSVAYQSVRVRLVLAWTRTGRPWPVFRVYPWVMDVLFPVGHPPGGSKAFDLPPGKSERSWEASPAVAGTILGMGGHLHDYGVRLELTDLTTGEVIGRAVPLRDSHGLVQSLPLVRLYRWYRLGVHIVPAHRYRIRVAYDNSTGQVIPDGGMGALAGMFVPDGGTAWPAVDTADADYRRDLHDTFWSPAMGEMHMGHDVH